MSVAQNVKSRLKRGLPPAVTWRTLGIALVLSAGCTGTSFVLIALAADLLAQSVTLMTLVPLISTLSLCSSVYLSVSLARNPSDETAVQRARIQYSETSSLRCKLQRDLHDGLGPVITAASMRIETARKLLDKDPDKVADLLEEANSEIESGLHQMRHLIRHLNLPGEVWAQRFDQAVKLMGAQFQQATGDKLKVTVDCPPLAHGAVSEVHQELYFIIREAIVNVVRHAHAMECLVKIAPGVSGITVKVIDDGTGFIDPRGSGIGLKSMRERAAALGGICVISNRASGGTQVEAFLPWTRSKSHSQGDRKEVLPQ